MVQEALSASRDQAKMGLFSKNSNDLAGHKEVRRPPVLDRARLLAQTIGHPRNFIQEAVDAQYDVETISRACRPAPAHAGQMLNVALHGGSYTREELAMIDALHNMREHLDMGIGQARQCLNDRQEHSNPGMDDEIRDCARQWEHLKRCWLAYKGTQSATWRGRVMDHIGQLAGGALGI